MALDDRDQVEAGNEEGVGEMAPPAGLTVCGLGASAGGLEALSEFLEGLDGNATLAESLGIVFVVVQHLHPDHPTQMPELLSRHTPLPVELAEDEVAVQPGRVYVIPSNSILSLFDGEEGSAELRLRVTQMEGGHRRGPATTIDRFFESLAEHVGERAVGVVLSGLGSDGTLGLRAIKERGGLALGQEGATAKFSSMPDSAAAGGVLDDILPARELPERVLDYARRLGQLRLRPDPALLDSTGAPDGDEFEAEASAREQPATVATDDIARTVLETVTRVLGDRVGYDFGGYKPGTILRRVERRMHVLRVDDPIRYLDTLSKDGDDSEARALFADLLIGVTAFFRDPEAFEALEKSVVPSLFAGRDPGEPVRVWSAGCSTGEEAYSLAMLMVEARERGGRPRPAIQVFGSDLDAAALTVARAGRYPRSIDQHIRPDRLDRFFRRDGDEYAVSRELRDLVLFSRHSLIADPPFGRIDLVACRNLLIYLQRRLQRKVIPLLHYALRPGGHMFLGSSESITGRNARLFTLVSRASDSPAAGPRRAADGHHAERPTARRRGRQIVRGRRGRSGDGAVGPRPRPPALARRLRDQRVDKALIDRYAPAAVAIDANGQIVYATGPTGRHLVMPDGPVDGSLASMVPAWMRVDVVAVVAASQRETREMTRLVIPGRETNRASVRISAWPIEDGLTLVTFAENESAASAAASASAPAAPADDAGANEEGDEASLRRELFEARENLSETVEQLEVSNEELKSSNEELLRMNEELQSANEELQTSKEEYQSANEELETVNSEIRRKVEELNEANSDLQNLFASAQVPTVFLDRGLNIKRFHAQRPRGVPPPR